MIVCVPGATSFSSTELLISNVTVGENLETAATIGVSEPAPAGALVIKLTSSDPSRVLLSLAPDQVGSGSIDLSLAPGHKRTQEFYVQGLTGGTATLTASAPGIHDKSAVAMVARSGVVIKGPAGLGRPVLATTRSDRFNITIYSAVIDESGGFVAMQPVSGGRSLEIALSSSDEKVGTVATSRVTIPAGSSFAESSFKPVAPGNTSVVATLPGERHGPVPLSTITATVITPGIGVLDGVTLGQNLQLPGSIVLGAPAPEGGSEVRLTSNDPSKLLLSTSATAPGSESISVTIPPGGLTGSYFVSSLGDQGEVTYLASAAGYRSRVGHVKLAPSGVVIGIGPPDEAELFRKDAADALHGFTASLSSGKDVPLEVYMEQLDPITHRGADITVQRLRAGVSVDVEIKNTNAAVGAIPARVTITGGSSAAAAPFTALHQGEATISVVTPPGFTTANNSISLKAIVQQ